MFHLYMSLMLFWLKYMATRVHRLAFREGQEEGASRM